MKSIFTMVLVALVSMSALAQQFRTTKLTISATGNAPVRVMVDGNRYSSGYGQSLVLRNLTPGNHTVKVFMRRNVRNNNGGMQSGGNFQAVYTAQVVLKPNVHTDITINRFGRAMVDEVQMGFGYYDEEDEDWGDNGNWNGNNGNWNGNNGNNGNWNGNNGNWGNNGQQCMDERTFTQFKQTLRNESFDNTRLTLAKQTIGTNWFTAAQVKELITLFSFENSKVDIAKYAYDFTVDKGNYFVVNDAFSYSSSREELSNYIRTKR
jgi:hypothetical protein